MDPDLSDGVIISINHLEKHGIIADSYCDLELYFEFDNDLNCSNQSSWLFVGSKVDYYILYYDRPTALILSPSARTIEANFVKPVKPTKDQIKRKIIGVAFILGVLWAIISNML